MIILSGISSELYHFSTQVRAIPRICVNNPDKFCYICGAVTFASQKRKITAVVNRHTTFILVAKLEIKTKVGLHIIVVTHVLLISANGSARKENLCPLQSQWFGENLQITIATATFA